MNAKSLFLLLLITSYNLSAQSADNALLKAAKDNQQYASSSQYETTFIPFYIENDSIKYFEKVGAKIESRAIGMGYGGINTYYTVFDKPESSVRFQKDSIPVFMILVDPGTDVFEMVLIVKADAVKNKNYRRFVKSGQTMTGSKNMDGYQLKPELKLIAKDKYQIVLPNMIAGEYAFMPIYKGAQSNNIMTASGSYRLFCFSIK